MRFAVVGISEAGPLQLATPVGVRLNSQQLRYLKKWSYTNMDPAGYGNHIREDLQAVGAASVDKQYVSIKLEGGRNRSISVDDIRPINIKRTAPLAGAFVNFPPQDGGEALQMIFNFDEAQPRARDKAGKDFEEARPGGLYFHNRSITLREGHEDSVVIKAITTRWSATFNIRIDYHVIGEAMESKHLILSNNGKPFALTALHCTQSTKLVPDGYINGRISYQDIWELGSTAMVRAANPRNHPIGSPYCLPPDAKKRAA
ncbi:hypothetical protein AB0H88_21465 [Nonomuraea sp. NPDC050680]|uniref:hypothetical protein n=1 Tax=Nonomuraea sp. NPDC050680 TaxID=3154630 RepID=UPI0033D58C0C